MRPAQMSNTKENATWAATRVLRMRVPLSLPTALSADPARTPSLLRLATKPGSDLKSMP